MHPFDTRPAAERNAIARREAVLNAVADYRYLAPHKLAADERLRREMAQAAALRSMLNGVPTPRSRFVAAARLRLGRALIAAGTRLQGNVITHLDPAIGT